MTTSAFNTLRPHWILLVVLCVFVNATTASADRRSRRRRRQRRDRQAQAAKRAQEAQQAQQQAEFEEARALFMAGKAAVASARWADALTNFNRAYELSKAVSALFNVGYAQRALGRHKEARDTFHKILQDHSDAGEATLERARQHAIEEGKRVATLTIYGLDPQTEHTIRIDAKRIDSSHTAPVKIEVNAGRHTLDVSAADGAHFEWTGQLKDGQQQDINVTLVKSNDTGTDNASKPIRRDGLLYNRWFWTAIGVAAIGAATTVGILVTQNPSLQPLSQRDYPL